MENDLGTIFAFLFFIGYLIERIMSRETITRRQFQDFREALESLTARTPTPLDDVLADTGLSLAELLLSLANKLEPELTGTPAPAPPTVPEPTVPMPPIDFDNTPVLPPLPDMDNLPDPTGPTLPIAPAPPEIAIEPPFEVIAFDEPFVRGETQIAPSGAAIDVPVGYEYGDYNYDHQNTAYPVKPLIIKDAYRGARVHIDSWAGWRGLKRTVRLNSNVPYLVIVELLAHVTTDKFPLGHWLWFDCVSDGIEIQPKATFGNGLGRFEWGIVGTGTLQTIGIRLFALWANAGPESYVDLHRFAIIPNIGDPIS